MTREEAKQLAARLKQTWGCQPKLKLCRVAESVSFTWCPILSINLAPNIQFECFPFGSFKTPACTISVLEEGDWEPILYAYWEGLGFLSWEGHEGPMGEAARQWTEEFQRKSWLCGFSVEASAEKKNQWLDILIEMK